MEGWRELDDGVLARRYAELDLTIGLVLGDEQALVIDTRGDEEQGAELAAAVRRVTSLPWQVVLTHGHFDHCFGTRAFLPAPVWAHERCGEFLARTAARQRSEWTAHYRDEGRHDIATALAATQPVLPDRLVSGTTCLDLGGRTVELRHPGHGHTDHDLVVAVPETGIVFAGDLVEQGAPPDFEDATPAQWPSTVDELLTLHPTVVVPGHGEPVDAGFVATLRAELTALAQLCQDATNGAITVEEALERSPYPAAATNIALARTAGRGHVHPENQDDEPGTKSRSS